jgi:DNA-binding CsgD family transcriptional regulator
MNVDATTLSLIETFYQAVLEPDAWQPALANVVNLFGSDHALLFTNKASQITAPFVATTGLDQEERARFFTPRAVQQWKPWQDGLPPGKVIPLTAYVSREALELTDIYNEVIRPTNGLHAAFVQQDCPDLSFHFAICRNRGADAFTAREARRLQTLLPHVTMALQLRQRLQAVEQRTEGLARLLDRLDEGVILATELGCCVHLNSRAERILGESDGLWLAGASLRSARPAVTRQLQDMIASAGASSASEARRLSLARPSGRLPLLLTILPIWRLGVSQNGTATPRVAIFIREPDAPLAIDRSALIDTFGLTPREADVAALLARGLGLETIAVELGLRISTVRYNLKHVFEKAGVHNQAGLVALVRCFGGGSG